MLLSRPFKASSIRLLLSFDLMVDCCFRLIWNLIVAFVDCWRNSSIRRRFLCFVGSCCCHHSLFDCCVGWLITIVCAIAIVVNFIVVLVAIVGNCECRHHQIDCCVLVHCPSSSLMILSQRFVPRASRTIGLGGGRVGVHRRRRCHRRPSRARPSRRNAVPWHPGHERSRHASPRTPCRRIGCRGDRVPRIGLYRPRCQRRVPFSFCCGMPSFLGLLNCRWSQRRYCVPACWAMFWLVCLNLALIYTDQHEVRNVSMQWLR